VQAGEEHAALPVQRVGHDVAGLELQAERGADQLRRHLEELARERHQLLLGQAAVPLPRGLGQREGDAGAHPDHRRALDAQPLGDAVGGAEADAADVARQPVGVLADDAHRVGP
jgi:hypothetical protein